VSTVDVIISVLHRLRDHLTRGKSATIVKDCARR